MPISVELEINLTLLCMSSTMLSVDKVSLLNNGFLHVLSIVVSTYNSALVDNDGASLKQCITTKSAHWCYIVQVGKLFWRCE